MAMSRSDLEELRSLQAIAVPKKIRDHRIRKFVGAATLFLVTAGAVLVMIRGAAISRDQHATILAYLALVVCLSAWIVRIFLCRR